MDDSAGRFALFGSRLRALGSAGAGGAVSPEIRRRIRILTIASLGLFLVGIPSVVQYAMLGVPHVALAIVATMLGALGNLAYVYRSHRPILCGHLAVGLLASLLLLSNMTSGGFYDPNFAWFYVLPLVAAVLLDLRGACIWAGVTLAIIGAFWGLDGAGIALPHLIPPELRHVQALFNRVTAVLGLAIIAASFVIGQRRSEHDLAGANEELTRGASYVQLLQYAAVASNEATSLEDAMRTSVLRICSAMGWAGGHVYVVDAEGELSSGSIWWLEDSDRLAPLRQLTERTRFRRGEGLPGRALESAHSQSIHELGEGTTTQRGALAYRLGLRAAFAVPVCVNGEVVAVLEFCSAREVPPDERLLEVLDLIGVQIGRVSERGALQERLRQSQKMEAVGQLAAGLAHEINNPMAYVRTNLNVLLAEWGELRSAMEKLDPSESLAVRFEECEDLIGECLEGTGRTITIVRDMKNFSSAGSSWESSPVEELVDAALRVASPQIRNGVRVERAYGSTPAIRCTPNPLRQVFLNLIVNAIHAVDAGGLIRIETREAGRQVVVRVEDDGPGVDARERERLFDPFYTTKPAGEGTGLGLYVSYEIVRNHGGDIRVLDSPSGGAAFEVTLPVAGPADSAQA